MANDTLLCTLTLFTIKLRLFLKFKHKHDFNTFQAQINKTEQLEEIEISKMNPHLDMFDEPRDARSRIWRGIFVLRFSMPISSLNALQCSSSGCQSQTKHSQEPSCCCSHQMHMSGLFVAKRLSSFQRRCIH